MKKLSLLETLHPDGIAHTCFVLGSNCPETLRPESKVRRGARAELFIVAPSIDECNAEGWFEAALQSLSDDLSADGVGYILVPPRWRSKVMRLLHQAGFVIESSFWHFPNLSSSRYLVPLERFPGQFMVDTVLPTRSLKRTLGMQMLRYSGTRHLLTNFWGPIGVAVRRPGARPLFQWLFQREGRSLPGTAIIRTSWRASNGSSIAYDFSRNTKLPGVVAKIILENTNHSKQEIQALRDLGPTARAAGIRVPDVVGEQHNDQYSVLFLSFLPGRPVSDLLLSEPDRFAPLMTGIVDALERWHRATVVAQPLKWEQFEQALLAPLNGIAPSLQNADQYRNWLVAHSKPVVGNPIPLVATHNDLTMGNILLDERDQFGMVDWETGCPDSMPLMDFYYALTDAVRITAKYDDWLSAFKACYLPEGSYFAEAVAWREQLELAISAPPGFATLCFHASWLHHAFNEQQVTHPGEPRPFLEIVQWLSLHELNINDK